MPSPQTKALTLTQEINLAYLSPKGYDVLGNVQSHNGIGIYESYLQPNEHIASGLTQLSVQITFVGKFRKENTA
jgi:hypothetical protein